MLSLITSLVRLTLIITTLVKVAVCMRGFSCLIVVVSSLPMRAMTSLLVVLRVFFLRSLAQIRLLTSVVVAFCRVVSCMVVLEAVFVYFI